MINFCVFIEVVIYNCTTCKTKFILMDLECEWLKESIAPTQYSVPYPTTFDSLLRCVATVGQLL